MRENLITNPVEHKLLNRVRLYEHVVRRKSNRRQRSRWEQQVMKHFTQNHEYMRNCGAELVTFRALSIVQYSERTQYLEHRIHFHAQVKG